MIKKIFFVFIFISAFTLSKAQINNIHNFYTQNLFYYSPAHTGDKGQLAAFINYRDQLVGFDNGGQTAAIGLHSPVTDRMSIGTLIKTERLGLFETLSGRLDYSFNTQIATKHKLAFGINVTALQRNLSLDIVNVVDPNQYDPTLDPNYLNTNVFSYGAAVSYSYLNFEFDFSIPILYRTGDALYTTYWSHSAFSFFSKSKKWQIKPSVAVSFSSVNSSVDLSNASTNLLTGYHANLLIDYNSVFWFQPTYKKNGSIAVGFGVNLKKIGVAYAYETNSGTLSAIGGPSHEVMISYGFFKPRKGLEDTLINDSEYKHNLKAKIGDKTYEEYVSSNNYGFYNNIIELTDAIHKEEVRKIEESKNIVNTDSIESARLVIIEQARLDSLEQAKQDSIRKHHLRNISDQEMKILEKGVHFELGSAMLNQESRKYLNSVAQLIKNNTNIKVLISGHTCDIGSQKTNLMYSQDRAEAVEYYLVSKGVNQRQISTDLKLDAEPIVPNTSEKNRQQNRRVSFSIIKE